MLCSVVKLLHSKQLESKKSILIDSESIEDRLIDLSTPWISSLQLNLRGKTEMNVLRNRLNSIHFDAVHCAESAETTAKGKDHGLCAREGCRQVKVVGFAILAYILIDLRLDSRVDRDRLESVSRSRRIDLHNTVLCGRRWL